MLSAHGAPGRAGMRVTQTSPGQESWLGRCRPPQLHGSATAVPASVTPASSAQHRRFMILWRKEAHFPMFAVSGKAGPGSGSPSGEYYFCGRGCQIGSGEPVA